MHNESLEQLFNKKVKRERVEELCIEHQRLERLKLVYTTVEDCRFKNVSFCGSQIIDCNFCNCVFEDCLFIDTCFLHSEIRYSNFKDCSLISTTLNESRLKNNFFKNCNLSSALFPYTTFSNQTFRSCTPNWSSKELIVGMLERYLSSVAVKAQTAAWALWAGSNYSGCWSNILNYLPDDVLQEGVKLLYKLYEDDPRKVKPANIRLRHMFQAYDQGEEGWKL